MNAVRANAVVLGVLAGVLGVEHGAFEVLQGGVVPSGPFIHAIGPPCQPAAAWHACEPALTLIPSLLVSGMLAMLAGAAVVVWAALLPGGRRAAAGLLVLVGALFAVGGGFMPFLFGLLAVLAAALVNSPLGWLQARLSPRATGLLAASWPWILLVLLLYEVAAWTVGSIANDVMLTLTPAAAALEPVVLAWILAAGFARNIRRLDAADVARGGTPAAAIGDPR